MAKQKKSRRVNSETILSKKSSTREKKLNPFEVHVNREKFKILGRKHKHDRGLPGVSKAKALKKRKQTIGKEFMELHKTNKFKDLRIGGEGRLTDELANTRFVAEKISQLRSRKKDLFNLNDDEVLTHKGQTIEEIEQFRDIESDISENEELDPEFTEAAHFGGENEKNDRKAVIDEMIAESKRKKAEIAKEKDEVYELTSKLDENYKNLVPLINKLNKDENEIKTQQDSYDRLVKELVFEPRGEVSDPLQTKEQISNKEKERIKKLEEERLARMKSEEENEMEKPKHKSADDLDDGYFVDSGEEEEGVLAYPLDDNIEDDKEDENNHVESENEDKNEQDLNGKEETEEASEDEEEEEEDDEEDNLSDLKDSESEADLLEREESPRRKTQKKNSQIKLEDTKEEDFASTFEVPNIYENLFDLLSDKKPNSQALVIQNIIKNNHPKSDPANVEKMVKLFAFLLQYLNDIFSNVNEENITNAFLIFDRLSPHFFDLIHFNCEKSSNHFLEVIKEKYDEYKSNSQLYPPLDCVIFFKLLSNLFSTSDFRHAIVTPCFIFINHILTRARPRNRTDVSIGLFLVTIILECTQLSKRFLPAVHNYLLGIIYLCVRKRTVEIIKTIPPFQSTGPYNNLLVLTNNENQSIKIDKLQSIDFVISSIDDDFKIRVLNVTLQLINDSIEIISNVVGACYIAQSYLDILDRLDLTVYPDEVKENFDKTKAALELVFNKPLPSLAPKEKKPKALRLMEPRIEKIYDDKRRPKMSKEKQERAILLHKVKRETKGAIREIRRDTTFLTKLQIKKQIESDKEREEKVRQIFAEASMQQGELNALARKRKKF